VQEALTKAKVPVGSAEITQVAKTPMDADAETQQKMLKLMEMLDDHDDVQNVYTNVNITDEVAAAAG
jgi:transcriptional/translational regulatory protein YebC/TACO1